MTIPIERILGTLTFSIREELPWYVIMVSGIASEERAAEVVAQLWTGLAWALVERDTAFVATQNLTRPLYGFIDNEETSVYPSGTVITVVTGHAPTCTVGRPATEFLATMTDGIATTMDRLISSDERLCTSLDLYSMHWQEVSANARFLALMTAFEVLAPQDMDKPSVVLQYLHQWREGIGQLLEQYPENSPERIAFESLQGDMLFRSKAPISNRIQALISEVLREEGQDSIDLVTRQALDAYRVRGKLVHGTRVTQEVLDSAIEDARNALKRVLKAKLRTYVCATTYA
jgi:hypothetical protein